MPFTYGNCAECNKFGILFKIKRVLDKKRGIYQEAALCENCGDLLPRNYDRMGKYIEKMMKLMEED